MLVSKNTKLANKIAEELNSKHPNIESIVNIFNSFEKNNLATIEKLKRGKKIELDKIHGAIKQTINAHGPITKELIGSCGKRIYGSLLSNPNETNKEFKKISLRDVLIGFAIALIIIFLF